MKAIKFIPNLFTLGNLLCGVLAIYHIFGDRSETAAMLVVLAAILDFFDGFLARLLKADGEMGKQLDSLADLVSFGVVPAFMLYHLSWPVDGYPRFAFLLLALFSAYRLAKFNIDTRQTTEFIGVPTPVTALMVISWVFIESDLRDWLFGSALPYAVFCVLISLLLVSEIRLPSLKIKKGPLRNYYRHLFLAGVCLVSALLWGWLCVPVFYLTYVLSSILFNFAGKRTS